MKYRARLRIRLTKALNAPEVARLIDAGGHSLRITSQKREEPLSEATWIVLTASGFPTEEEARQFGERLKIAAAIAGVCTRLGVDVGLDRATSYLNEEWARAEGIIKPHERLAPNVHGLAVVPDDDNTRFPLIEATATVRAAPEHFLGAITELTSSLPANLASDQAGVRLMNLALLNPQPLAQIAFALSAVEALGQSETWTERQAALLDQLAAQVEAESGEGEPERAEVADALRRSIHRIGLRQGVMRVLDRLGLRPLRKEWDRIYGLRSGIFHGSVSLSDEETAQLALDALTLCGRVVLSVAQSDGVVLPTITVTHFPE